MNIKYNLSVQMGLLKEILLNFNGFNTQQFFRFNGDYEYTNALGGIFTICIRGLLCVMLIIKLIAVFNFSEVKTTVITKYEVNEVNTTLSTANTESPFLLAIEVYETSGKMSKQTLRANSIAWSLNFSRVYTILQPCTADHWSAVQPQIYQHLLEAVEPSSILFCLPKNFTHTMSINQVSTLEIDYAFSCKGNCSSAPLTSLLVRPILYNRIINSQNSSNYLISYLEKRRYYGIDTSDYQFDTALNYQINKYQVQTDNSLFPFESVTSEKGINIPQQPGLSYYPNRYETYIFFRMTYILGNKQYYHFRSFTKIFDAISLIGGLIPVFMLIFMWLNYYAMAQFQMTFVKRMHSDQRAREYGVFYFISKLFYSVLRLVNIDIAQWKETQHYHQMHKKVAHLIDILYLYKRLEFLERAMEMILEDHQLKVLHLMRHKTLQEAEQDYQLYEMKLNLQRFMEKKKIRNNKKSQQSKQSNGLKNHCRQIFLDPQPASDSNGIQPQSHKNLVISREFEENIQPKIFEDDLQKNQNRIQQQPQSQYNEEHQNMQMNNLREAYRCYERLKRESQNQDTSYFSCISKNIYSHLDSVDKELLQNLNTLLKQSDRQEVLNTILKDFAVKEKEQTNLEEMIYKRSRQLFRSSSHPIISTEKEVSNPLTSSMIIRRHSNLKPSLSKLQEQDED